MFQQGSTHGRDTGGATITVGVGDSEVPTVTSTPVKSRIQELVTLPDTPEWIRSFRETRLRFC